MVRGKKFAHRGRITEIELGAGAQQQLVVSRRLQTPHQRRTHQPSVSGHEDFVGKIHAILLSDLLNYVLNYS